MHNILKEHNELKMEVSFKLFGLWIDFWLSFWAIVFQDSIDG